MLITTRDSYTQVEYTSVESASIVLGQTIIQYEIQAYTDTRNLETLKSYIVTCTQRLLLPNQTRYITGVDGVVTSYINYPALLSNKIAVSDPDSVLSNIKLIDYSPRTLNTAVATNQNIAQSTNSSVLQQYTSGSANSQTNSFDISLSDGFFGDLATGDFRGSLSSSFTKERSRSKTQGTVVDSGSQLSNSSSMTIKDWGGYASIDKNDPTPTWVWGQEYPWNVIQFKSADQYGDIQLPQFVQQRLWDGQVLYSPSDLSLFGVDFVSKASWVLTPSAPLTGVEPISFIHTLIYGTGTHGVTSGKLSANLNFYQPITYSSSTLDLPVLALDPLQDNQPAIVGFVANKFDVAPTSSGSLFAVTSDTNDLIVRGSGFNGLFSTDFSTGTVQMTVYFKLIDPTRNLLLHIKNWTKNNTAVQLSIVVNNNTTMASTKFVDAPETGSGTDNVTVIALRNRDFSSVDYCDWLQMGLNTVSITFSVAGSSAAPYYQALALAVG